MSVDLKIGLRQYKSIVLAFIEQNDGETIDEEIIAAVSGHWMRGNPEKAQEREALFVDFVIKVVLAIGEDQGANLGPMLPTSADGTIIGGRG